MEQTYDYIICLTGAKVQECKSKDKEAELQGNNIADILKEDTVTLESSSLLVEIVYCCYNLKDRCVNQGYEGNLMISYLTNPINEVQLEQANIPYEKYKVQAVPFKEAIQKFNEFIYQNFVRESKSFCFMTFGNDLLTKIIPDSVRKAQDMKLAPHFYTYFDIQVEFQKHLPHAVSMYTLSDMLSYTNLKKKDNSFEHFAQGTCKSIVRLLNMLVSEGHILANPKMINNNFETIVDQNDTKGRYLNQRQKRSKINYVRGKSPSPFKNPTRGYFLRLRGLPHSSTEYEVYEFMRGIRLYKEDIAFEYDGEGKFTGEVFLRLNQESDKYEAMNFNLGEMEKHIIEIFETNENEWMTAKQSQYADQKDKYRLNQDLTNSSVNITEAQGVIKLKNLSSKTTEQDIKKFFAQLQIVQIRRAVIGGKPGSECFVVFKDKQDSHLALTYHMEKLNNRFVEVTMSNKQEFINYMAHNFQNDAPTYTKDNMPAITADKKKSTLMVTGLPFSVNKQQLQEFFQEYEVRDRDIYLLNSHSNKFSGNAIITFEDELECQRALKQKNFAYLGSRYIELFQYK